MSRLCTAIVVLLLGLLHAAELPAQIASIPFQRLSTEQGLSQGTVNCILQDRTGFIWLGTQDGLNRYDGYGFRVYENDPARPSSLPSNWISDLAEDPSGDLWVGTQGGLARWRRATDTFERIQHDPADPASLPGNSVRALQLDGSGTLWIGTFQSGLARRVASTGEFERFRHDSSDPASLSDDRTRALHVDRDGNLWVGTLGGLNVFDAETESFARYRHDGADPASLSDDRVYSILQDSGGTLWVGTENGLNRRRETAAGFTRFQHDPADPTSLADNWVTDLLEDSSGRLWIATDGGLHLPRSHPGREWGGGFFRYLHDATNPLSLSNDRLLTAFQDRGGVMWVGTQGGGVNKWNPITRSFSHYQADPAGAAGLSSNSVFAFSQDAAGRLWVGTLGGGLNVVDRESGRFTYHRHDPSDPASLPGDQITALYHDRDRTLWVGTLGSGLGRRASGSRKFRNYRHDPERLGSLSNDNVSAIVQDLDGAIWIATHGGGLNRFEEAAPGAASETFTSFLHDPARPRSLSDDHLNSLAVGTDGSLWAGTFGGGLNRLDGATSDDGAAFQRLQHEPERLESLSSNAISALHVDPDGVLWVGTLVGLNRLDELGEAARFRHYSELDGLANNNVWGIQSDGEGRIWVSTNNGLSRLDPQTEKFKNYDRSHGLQGSEFNFGAHFQNAEGELFFGGTNGFNVFLPEEIEPNPSVPPVVLTAFTKLNQPVPLNRPVFDVGKIALDYRDDIVSFEFAALDYTAPEKNRYRYRLEGFNNRWIDNGHRRRVDFTDLDPGDYVFRVQGSNNDGVWNEKGLSLAILVTPPFWQTWWFRGLALLAVAAAIRIGHEVRVRQIRRHNEELQGLVKKRTRALEDAQERLVRQERLAVLGELAGSVAHEIRNPLAIMKNSIFFLRMSRRIVDEKAEEHLDLLDHEIHRANMIITELLDYARDRSPESERLSLQGIAEKALASLAVPDAVRVESRFEPRPVLVEADPGQIERLLANLLRNAVQAMPEGGTLGLTSGIHNGEAIVAVTDTGGGIAAEDLAKIFEPLYTTKSKGIGLGLALSKRYAQLNRGRIECESVVGKGTTFRLVLPVPLSRSRASSK